MSLAVHASVGAIDPIAPRYAASGDLPAALPSIFTGLRIGLGIGWTAVIVSEMVAVKSGLGYAILKAQRFLKTDTIFAGILLIGVIGLLSDQAFRWLHRRSFPWLHGRG